MDRSDSSASVPVRHAPRRRGWLRGVVPAVILGALLWRLGTGPFLEGLARVDARSLAVGTGLGVVVTLSCAWRWTLVSQALGLSVPLRPAVAACYRSQFVNVATPGGVLGDVDRGLRQGRQVGDGRGFRSVVWDRLAGQAVLMVVAAVVLVLLPSPVRDPARVVGASLVTVTMVVGGLAVALRGGTSSWSSLRHTPVWEALVHRAGGDFRAVWREPRTRARILLVSCVALACHVLNFLVAARTAGADGAVLLLLPLALVVILAMGLPSVAGWGPREGAAAWVFGAGGLGAQEGVATAVVYGAMVFVGVLPGALVLLLPAVRQAGSVLRA